MRAMPDQITVRVNLPDFRRQLQEIGDRMEKRVVRGALRDASRVFQRAAKQRAPVLRKPDPRRVPGRLRESIVVASVRGPRGVIRFRVVPRARKATRRRGKADLPFYWVWLEGGWIPRGPGRRLRGGQSRKREIRASSGRTYRYPFLAPAFQGAQGAALAAYSSSFERRIALIQSVK
jgi:hypothetical protein